MSPLYPPLFRGKIPTTPGRLLAAAGIMFLLDLPVFIFFAGVGLLFHLAQVLVMIVVLLFSARRWVAAVWLALISLAGTICLGLPTQASELTLTAFALIPLWVGTFIAYPRPRKRVVFVEADDEEQEGPGS